MGGVYIQKDWGMSNEEVMGRNTGRGLWNCKAFTNHVAILWNNHLPGNADAPRLDMLICKNQENNSSQASKNIYIEEASLQKL